jgi:hypothetical protein
MPFIKSTWLVKNYLQLDVNKLLSPEFSYLYSKKTNAIPQKSTL